MELVTDSDLLSRPADGGMPCLPDGLARPSGSRRRAVKAPPRTADATRVRSRLTIKLVSLAVMLVLTGLGARACSGSSASSPTNPVNVARNGLAAICANQQAVASAGDASGSGAGQPAGPAVSPSELAQLQASDPAGLRALEQAAGGTLTCPTTPAATPGG